MNVGVKIWVLLSSFVLTSLSYYLNVVLSNNIIIGNFLTSVTLGISPHNGQTYWWFLTVHLFHKYFLFWRDVYAAAMYHIAHHKTSYYMRVCATLRASPSFFLLQPFPVLFWLRLCVVFLSA